MAKLTAADILKPGVTLEDLRKGWPTKEEMKKIVAETLIKQEAILKQKEISPESLEIRMTI